MKRKRMIALGLTAALTVGALGIQAYGLEDTKEEENRITLETSINMDGGAKLEESSFNSDEGLAIADIPVQEEAHASLPNIKKVAADVMPAIVAITNVGVEQIDFFGTRYEFDSESSGSGIIVAKSDTELLIATNNHVVEGAEELTICFSVTMDDPEDEDEKLVPAQVKGTDSSLDLAVVAVNHVVEGAEELTICFSVTMDDPEDEDEKLVPAQVKGTDSSLDLAVVAVKLDDISEEVADKIGIVQMGDSDTVEVGEWAVAIGNALGYGQSVTFGIISALDREVSVNTVNGVVTNNMLQTDAAINGGNSGGALLDMEGRLIGINSAKASATGVEGMGYAIPINAAKDTIEINGGNSGGALLDMEGRLIGINSAKASATGVEGMGYAIPINAAKDTIEELMNQTTRTKVDEDKAGALGVVPIDVSEEAVQIYNLPAGAFVSKLTEDSAAEKAGIRQGDIITKIEKTSISSKADLMERMKYYAAGETIVITVKRAGEDGYAEKEFEVTLGKKSDLPKSENELRTDDGSQRENREDVPEEYYDYGYDDGYGGYFGDFDDFFGGFGF